MTQTDDTGYPEPDEKQIKAHKTGKHLEILREKIHSEDALDRAYQTGWEHGAADATNHKEYKLPISEPMHDEWDKRYATGYDAGFEKVATSDEPPETPSRPEYIRESRFA